jgi:hypothetical protein
MFVYQDAAAAAAAATVAMQEIEVISMDDGEDNVTTNSIPSPQSAVASLPPSRAPTTTSSDRAPEPDSTPAMDVLIAMLANERTLPAVDHIARSSIEATPISKSRVGAAASFAAPGAPAARADAARNAARDREDVSDPVNDNDRTKMCDWYYEMSDFLKIDRETASRSMSLLDRFMAAPVHHMVRTTTSYPSLITASSTYSSSSSSKSMPEEQDQDRPYNVAGVVVAASRIRDEYQLVALTALFLSIKLFERLNIQLEHVSYLSRGRYTAGEVMRMELVILHALEWRVCCADKVDYVNAYLDVMLPDKQHVGDPYHHMLLTSIKDLADIQIKMSDYESSFSKQKPSLVAFASVINAFEMRKDDFSNDDLRYFLQSAHGLMTGMDQREQEELLRTAERLRALVDPSSAAARNGSFHYFFCGGSSLPLSVDLILSSCREGGVDSMIVDDASHSSSDTSSQLYAKVSPLDMALESMENLNVAHLLCCGGIDHSSHHHNSNNNARHRGNHDRIVPGKKQQHGHATTNGSGGGMAKSHSSPTSIATIIFGAAAKKA